jgi:hypothetical protein
MALIRRIARLSLLVKSIAWVIPSLSCVADGAPVGERKDPDRGLRRP